MAESKRNPVKPNIAPKNKTQTAIKNPREFTPNERKEIERQADEYLQRMRTQIQQEALKEATREEIHRRLVSEFGEDYVKNLNIDY